MEISNVFVYLLKVSLISAILYGLFMLFFQKHSFNALNRLFLLFIIVFSCLCPFLELNYFRIAGEDHLNTLLYESFEFPVTQADSTMITTTGSGGLSIFHVLLFIYLSGCLIFLIRFILQLVRIIRLRLMASGTEGKYPRIIISRETEVPFSFFNWIFFPARLNENPEEKKSVLNHERTHAKLLHTFDLIISEFYIIFWWFNPVGYLLKRSIKQIHEYQADSNVVKHIGSLPDYLELLIREKQKQVIPDLCHSFSNISLKTRIMMMTKPESPRYKKLSYLIILPTITLMLFAFSGQKDDSDNIPCISPISKENLARISSHFGMREHPVYKDMRMHKGMDLVAPEGTPVLATADGRVVKTEFKEEGKGHGRLVLIQHNEIYSTLYTQLSAFNVQAGDRVKQGDVVGYVGTSGFTTGPHLHYEIHKNGEPTDPKDYFGE